jgi:hypothetical protein
MKDRAARPTGTQITIRRRGIILLAVTLALATAGGVAYATIPDSNNVYTACMLKSTGTIRLIDGSLPAATLMSHCTSLETSISWNQKGPQGIQGLKGDKGDPGKDGVNGTNGVDGKDGAPGTPGADGKDGAPGADGKDGINVTSTSEPAGASCAFGGSAFTAANGITYACNGARGADGKDGATGATGPQGPRGPQGVQGPPGPTISSVNALDGIPCHGDNTDWPATLEVSVGPGADRGGSGGAVTMKCVPVAPAILSLSWTGYGSFGLRYPGASSLFSSCFPGVQPGPTYSCSVNVIPGRVVEIEAAAGTLSGTLVSWGGACADIGSKFGWSGECRLTMDSDKSASTVFNP